MKNQYLILVLLCLNWINDNKCVVTTSDFLNFPVTFFFHCTLSQCTICGRFYTKFMFSKLHTFPLFCPIITVFYHFCVFCRNVPSAQNTHKGNANNAFNDLNKISANTTISQPPLPSSLSGPSAVTSIGSPARRCEVSPIQNHVSMDPFFCTEKSLNYFN